MNMTTVPSDKLKELQAENAELKELVAHLQTIISEEAKDSGNVILELNLAKETIAEQQSHIEQLREALADTLGCWERDCVADDYFRERAESRELLAIQSSSNALREHDAQLVGRIAAYLLLNNVTFEEIADKIRKGEFNL